MRIISGKARGTKLISIASTNTRPTIDRVKENIFNIIQFDIPNKTVVDFFAGSGALVLECLSRGAKMGYFIEINDKAISAIQTNLLACSFGLDQYQLINSSYEKGIDKLIELDKKMDIVFLDPPYNLDPYTEILDKLIYHNLLNPNAIIIIETFREKVIKYNSTNFDLKKEKVYGNVKILILYKIN